MKASVCSFTLKLKKSFFIPLFSFSRPNFAYPPPYERKVSTEKIELSPDTESLENYENEPHLYDNVSYTEDSTTYDKRNPPDYDPYATFV